MLARAIGEVAVLESIGEDDRFDPVTRAVALLEAATRRRRELDDVAEQSALIDVAVTAAARLLTGQEDTLQRLVDADEFLALETSKAMAEWAQHPSIRRASDALSTPPERFREVRAAIAGAHLRSAAAEFALDELALPTGEPDVELSDGGLLTLRTPEYRPGTWMRVTEVGPMALLALVPVLDDDGAGIAHAVIGSGYALADLDIEVTDEPVRGSGHRLSAIAHAVALGREAAVRMVNDRRAALRLWESCAQAWEAVDDERRAELARRYAFSGGTGRRPFLAERIDDALNDVA